ncbi:hypothetical protein BFW01_g4661 [Lasiodiplodia theobromae]|nr:hypothetical protein BFW01_g4661 [Lasiodiplodia theobromae]
MSYNKSNPNNIQKSNSYSSNPSRQPGPQQSASGTSSAASGNNNENERPWGLKNYLEQPQRDDPYVPGSRSNQNNG